MWDVNGFVLLQYVHNHSPLSSLNVFSVADGAAQRFTIVRLTAVALLAFAEGGFLAFALVGCTANRPFALADAIHWLALPGNPYTILSSKLSF